MPTDVIRRLTTGIGVLVGGIVLALPVVWWTLGYEARRVAAHVNEFLAESSAEWAARRAAGDFPPDATEPAWDVVVPGSVPAGTVLLESLPFGAAALAGYLLAGTARRGRRAAAVAALVVLVWSALGWLVGPVLPLAWPGPVVPLGMDDELLAVRSTTPAVLMPAVVMAALVLLGAALTRPPDPDVRDRRADVVVGTGVLLALTGTVLLELAAVWRPGTLLAGLIVPTLALTAATWLASGVPGTSVLGPMAMLAAAGPYLADAWSSVTVLLPLGVVLLALVAVSLAGLRVPTARAVERLLV